jgi:hypothetical protein
MRGLIVSIGGLSEGLVKHSWGATLKHLQQAPPSTRQRTAKHFMSILSTCRECKGDTKGGGGSKQAGEASDRVVVPLFKTAHLFITNGLLDDLSADNDIPQQLLVTAQQEMRGSGDICKLDAGASLVAGVCSPPYLCLSVSIRQHASACVSIRQHTSAYAISAKTRRWRLARRRCVLAARSIPECQHTSAYVSIRQHTSAYVSVCYRCSPPYIPYIHAIYSTHADV